MDNPKTFDCVAMKHTAAAALSDQLQTMTVEEQLVFWQQRTEELEQQQRQTTNAKTDQSST